MFCLKHDGNQYVEVGCEAPDALVVVTRIELAQYSPFYLSIESAMAIGGALWMALAVAFVVRMVIKSLGSERETQS